MPMLTNPRKYAMLLLAILLISFQLNLRAESTGLSPEAQAKLAPEYGKLAELEMSDSDAEKMAGAIENIVKITNDDTALQVTREVTAVYAPAAADGLKWRKLEKAGPWILSGGAVVLVAAFFGGVIIGMGK